MSHTGTTSESAPVTTVYTATVRSLGDGRDGSVRADDGRLSLPLSPPGSGRPGTNPEQLFAAGYAACFHSALRLSARERRIPVTATRVVAEVDLRKSDSGFGLAVRLLVEVDDLDAERVQVLIDAAHARCPYSRAVAGNVDVTLIAGPAGEPASA